MREVTWEVHPYTNTPQYAKKKGQGRRSNLSKTRKLLDAQNPTQKKDHNPRVARIRPNMFHCFLGGRGEGFLSKKLKSKKSKKKKTRA